MATGNPLKKSFNGLLLDEAAIKVSAAIMDHRIPCLAFALSERYHVNIRKDALQKMGLPVGPWLREFKQALYDQQAPETPINVTISKASLPVRQIPLKDLKDRIAIKTPGQKVAYVTDVAYSPDNQLKIVELARQADCLFIEAAFLEEDRQIATKKYHLTAWQAGLLAAQTRARQFTIFHFSPRYTGRAKLLQQEALAAYHNHVSVQK